MMEVSKGRTGMTYNQTVLESMMLFPTIFPNQAAVDQHLFFGYGTGYAWNEHGELVYYLPPSKPERKPERTWESVIGEHKEGDKYCNHCRFVKNEDAHFHSIGISLPYWNHDYCEHSPLAFVLSDKVTPNADWMRAIKGLTHDVLRPRLADYRPFLLAITKHHYPCDWPMRFDTIWAEYMEMRRVCEALQKKWGMKKNMAYAKQTEKRRKFFIAESKQKLAEIKKKR